MSIGKGVAVSAAAKNAHAIKCGGALNISEGADVSCVALVNYGATVNGEVEALSGIYKKAE